MIALRDFQFEILPEEDASRDGYAFGMGRAVSVNDGGFTPAERAWMVQDGVNATRGTTMFGRDVQTAGTWAWSCHTDQDDDREALAAAGAFGAAWMPPGGSEKWEPGQVTTLRYRIGGRTRRIYGRPRRFAAPTSNLMLSGNIPINADFVMADPRHYSDELKTARLDWAPGPTGGVKLPVHLPLRTQPTGDRQGSIVVDGDVSTFPIIKFHGPVSDPSLAGDDFELILKATIPSGDWVTIDTRPWHLTVLNSSGTSLAGKLGRRQWLEDMVLRPGRGQLSYRGSSSGGSASCEVSWRDAWSNL